MRVRTYFLIAGAIPLCLIVGFVAWVTFVSDFIWNRERPLFGQHFPPITHWDTLKITLDRTMCLGTCPVYTFELHGDGTLSYTGELNVAVFGQHRGHVSRKAVRALFQKFEEADFFSSFEFYGRFALDAGSTRVSIAFDGHHKSIEYVGPNSRNLPSAVAELEHDVDTISGYDLWVNGKGDVFGALQAEHWDFRANGHENSLMIVAARMRDDQELAKKLVAAGMVPASPEKLFISPKSP